MVARIATVCCTKTLGKYLRPVLSIKARVEITGGNGSPQTPFLIGTQS